MRAVMLHRHELFRDLIATELHDLELLDVIAATADRDEAMTLVLRMRPNALVVERHEGFVTRQEILDMFCRAAAAIPGFTVIAPELATSRVEVLRDTIVERGHLGSINVMLHEVP